MRIERLIGVKVESYTPLAGGYSLATRLLCRTTKTSFFAKIGATPLTNQFLRREMHVYNSVSRAFMPKLDRIGICIVLIEIQTLTPESGLSRWAPIFPPLSPPTGRYVLGNTTALKAGYPDLVKVAEGRYLLARPLSLFFAIKGRSREARASEKKSSPYDS